MFGTDTLCSYGSMAKFKDVERVAKIGEHTLFASSGEFSDF
jgi:20S proteasome alpha/beta subunit